MRNGSLATKEYAEEDHMALEAIHAPSGDIAGPQANSAPRPQSVSGEPFAALLTKQERIVA